MTFEPLDSRKSKEPADTYRQFEPLFTRQDLITGLLLILILAAGAYFRFTGQNWDDYTHLHPDERHMADVTDRIGGPLDPVGNDSERGKQVQACLERYPKTQGVADSIFDSQCSTYYPLNVGKSYFYGELPLFVVKFASQVTASVTRHDAWLPCHG